MVTYTWSGKGLIKTEMSFLKSIRPPMQAEKTTTRLKTRHGVTEAEGWSNQADREGGVGGALFDLPVTLVINTDQPHKKDQFSSSSDTKAVWNSSDVSPFLRFMPLQCCVIISLFFSHKLTNLKWNYIRRYSHRRTIRCTRYEKNTFVGKHQATSSQTDYGSTSCFQLQGWCWEVACVRLLSRVSHHTGHISAALAATSQSFWALEKRSQFCSRWREDPSVSVCVCGRVRKCVFLSRWGAFSWDT